ncbi:hypothetical protein TREMEDRAFT_65324 [Tremella mesenterica DSM 1558]|uniref:uncharacterized protein n=1 Tax=Tremella mesenterica (strain ATCC 24925 / CBS 8224 / DSM 1558 / NBRC 9311 / NRRL Y-6157 / RJB 2259-6 / UBC 559-6) TaxID=578456 RepID=UPI00032CDF91|nr:uncharacterized protein TREMEDRAFT_65324 [Tremella mesenterica DSM 1558]EIW66464.1 hypothetical protein TREMEDRAFT_65324 [Tremella mesenterica DSM 1558]
MSGIGSSTGTGTRKRDQSIRLQTLKGLVTTTPEELSRWQALGEATQKAAMSGTSTGILIIMRSELSGKKRQFYDAWTCVGSHLSYEQLTTRSPRTVINQENPVKLTLLTSPIDESNCACACTTPCEEQSHLEVQREGDEGDTYVLRHPGLMPQDTYVHPVYG